jgi:dienelactone hydrolase
MCRTLLLFSLGLISFCINNFAALGTAVTLPTPTGPYNVGTRNLEHHDSTRKMLRGKDKQKWMVQAFYPTNDSTKGTFPYMPETLKDGKIQSVKVYAFSHPFAEISDRRRFPVIIFVPGLGGIRQDYTIICEELASHGYVVLSFDQPYVSNFVRFPDGSVIMPTFYDLWKVKSDRDYRYRYYDEAMKITIEDIKCLLDRLVHLSREYFNKLLDCNRVGIMGHSFGGNVAHTLGFIDPRVKAIVDIDSKITEREIFGRIGVPPNLHSKPVLFIRASLQYQENVGDQLFKISNATVEIFSVEHSAFTDKAFFVKKIKSFGEQCWLSQFWNYLFKITPPFFPVDTDVREENIDKWFVILKKRLVNWLKINL